MSAPQPLPEEASLALRAAWTDVLVACARLGEGSVGAVPAEEVRAHLLQRVKEGRARLLLHRVPEAVVDRVQRPVVALVDESARRCAAGQMGLSWRPLAVELYGHDRLGGEVFADLDRLRAEPTAPVEVIEVFVRCLALGLEGQLLAGRPDALRELREALLAEVRRRGRAPAPLCPDLHPLGPSPDRAPVLPPLWIGACAAGILLATAAVFSLALRSEVTAARGALGPLVPETQVHAVALEEDAP